MTFATDPEELLAKTRSVPLVLQARLGPLVQHWPEIPTQMHSIQKLDSSLPEYYCLHYYFQPVWMSVMTV